MRFLFLLSVAFCCAVANGQQYDLSKDDLSKLVKLGEVSVSSGALVKLTFPDGFMDDEIRGCVVLINDSDETADVSNVTTSCGCTAAIPIEKQV